MNPESRGFSQPRDFGLGVNPNPADFLNRGIFVSELGDSLDKCLLNNLANNLIPENRSEFYNRVNELNFKDVKIIEVIKDKFNPKAMFPFE